GTILLQYKSQLIGAKGPNTSVFGKTGFTIDISGGNGGIYYTGQPGGYGRYLAQQDTGKIACNAPNLNPKANNIAGSVTVCSGSTVTLTANATGGSGCTGTTEFSWSDGTYYWNGTSFASARPVYNSTYGTISAVLTDAAPYIVTARCSADTN